MTGEKEVSKEGGDGGDDGWREGGKEGGRVGEAVQAWGRGRNRLREGSHGSYNSLHCSFHSNRSCFV